MNSLYAPVCKIHYCNDGNRTPDDLKPGDFILLRGNGLFSRLIQFGQAFRYGRGENKALTYFTHTALIITSDGELVEALSSGVKRSHISDYPNYMHISIDASDEDRAEVVRFADGCVGQQYGWATIVSIALSLLTGLKFSFGFDGQEICSGLVARALERTTAIFPRDPSHIMPYNLALYYKTFNRLMK